MFTNLAILGASHIMGYIYKFHHDRILFSLIGIMVNLWEIIPFYGRNIQVSEIL